MIRCPFRFLTARPRVSDAAPFPAAFLIAPADSSLPSSSRTRPFPIWETEQPRPIVAPPACARSIRNRAAQGGYSTPSSCTSKPPASAGQRFPQIGFSTLQRILAENFHRHTALAVVILLAMYFRHLLLVGRHPNGSTLFVRDIRRQCG